MSAQFLILLAGDAKDAASASAGLPQFDLSSFPGQIFWLAVLFALMFAMMNWVFLPKLGGIIEERKNRIADFYDKAAEFKRQAETAEADYKQALADANARASTMSAETRAQMEEEISKMQSENDEKLNSRIEASELHIAEMATKAQETVTEAATGTAAELVAALTGETPDAGKVKSAVTKAVGGAS